jgi:glyoxylase-like metal-dependent hydrolase (beta-lactamase superfamily II)
VSLVGAPRARRPRTDEVLPGVWRLRLPLVWEEIPYVNAWAIDDGAGGCVLVDCGMAGPGAWEALAGGLRTAGWGPEAVSLLVCTHAHGDHYGQAAAVLRAAGCELWMHPAHGHMTGARADLAALAAARRERARRAGAPAELVELAGDTTEEGEGVVETVLPDRPLLEGAEVGSRVGRWVALETPGHAPSHAVLHQPDRRLLISGDVVMPGDSAFLEGGDGRDPVAGHLASLARIAALGADGALPGHGRPFDGASSRAAAQREALSEELEATVARLADRPATAWDLLAGRFPEVGDVERSWLIGREVSVLEHLEAAGRVRREADDAGVERWRSS